MSFSTNNLYRFYKFILKFRVAVIAIFTSLFIYLALNMTTLLTHNGDKLWLQGSSEVDKLVRSNHKQIYIQKLRLDVGYDTFSIHNIDNLKQLHSNLENIDSVIKINSPLTHTVVYKSVSDEGSSLVEAKELYGSSSFDIQQTLENTLQEFLQFYSSDMRTLYVYVFSSERIDYSKVYIPFDYDIIETIEEQNTFKDIILFSILLTTLFILFTISFRSIIPSILGIIFISFTTLFTISIYQIIQPDVEIHVSILLVAITVSIMDFVYIYYGWHILQMTHNSERSIYYIIMKTFKPILWTTFVSVVGMGLLIFENSIILQSIGFNVILSAGIAFILSFTLLIAMLSFFEVKNPHLLTKNTSKFFAALEAQYEKSLLKTFMYVTAIVFITSLVFTVYNPSNIVTKANDEVISIVFESDGLTHESLKKLERFHNEITNQFEDDISDVVSIYKYTKDFSMSYNPSSDFDVSKVDLDFITFDFHLYGIYDDMIKNKAFKVEIYIEEDGTDKNVILQWIREWDKENTTLLDDINSLLNAAKYDTTNNMVIVVLIILLLITIVIYHLTNSKRYALIALVVNVIPLIWFFAILIVLNISLSIEILVAMLIMIALSSDATIHFLFYYNRHTRKEHSDEKFLEDSFIEVGTPIGLGSTILLITFLLLVFANIPTISSIGIYSVVLIIFSLLADLFILPVLFIDLIKSKLLNK